ncbi:PhnD/SsuA/transferrin family substrate-binding protein [Breoghania sp.]|uniref:sensor histidine kinase n=1 Tax=Breoghania sp. TaxID=2065378 RepID=UPI002AA74D87|nr:PhnD/SsuA/transferrin family substrate-binding protein [Breoghania sp.]
MNVFCILVFLLCLQVLPMPVHAASKPVTPLPAPLKIGALNYMGEDQVASAWTTTVAMLNRALPDYRFEIVALTIPQMTKALEAGSLAFIITNPGQYAVLEYQYKVSRIATLENGAPVASTVVAIDPDIKTLDDLAGRRVAINSVNAFGGFQLIWRELHALGIDPPDGLRLVETGSPMSTVADAVLAGKADAGVLRGCLLEGLQAGGSPSYGKLHAVGVRTQSDAPCALSSPIYPNWPFAKTKTTDPRLAKEVAQVLLAIPDDGTNRTWTVPLDYQPVLEVFRELKIGPYARHERISVREFFVDYREWFIGGAVGLLFWGLYFVRVETLVRNRTKALAEANDTLLFEMAERKKAETRAEERQRELEHVARLSILGEMATAIAHELNQPLGAIAAYGQGCQLRIEQGSFTQADMKLAAGEIVDQAQRAAKVVQRIRAFVRKRHSEPEAVNLNRLVEDCRVVFEATTTRAGIAVQLEQDRDLPSVLADRVQIEQVVFNLVQNAVDALKARDGGREHRIVLTTGAENDGVRLSVRDTAGGLSDDILARFAEPFLTTKNEGIGLGLALSRSIMEAHGGRLWAERTAQGETRVSFWLPTPHDAARLTDQQAG